MDWMALSITILWYLFESDQTNGQVAMDTHLQNVSHCTLSISAFYVYISFIQSARSSYLVVIWTVGMWARVLWMMEVEP